VPSLSALKRLWDRSGLKPKSIKPEIIVSPDDHTALSLLLRPDYIIRPSPKRLSLRFDTARSRFVLNWPPKVSIRAVLDFLNQNRDWILRITNKSHESKILGHDDAFTLLGRLTVIEFNEDGRPSLNHFLSTANDDVNDRLLYCGNIQLAPYRLERHIRKLTLEHAHNKITHYAHCLDKDIEKVSLFSARTRWGSCSPRTKNIRIHWRLGLGPIEVLDYVCAHEAAHLRHPDHSAAFWACVGGLMPHYQEPRAWLKTNGASLHSLHFKPKAAPLEP
jgi:predicted metal-dependent hydrolase